MKKIVSLLIVLLVSLFSITFVNATNYENKNMEFKIIIPQNAIIEREIFDKYNKLVNIKFNNTTLDIRIKSKSNWNSLDNLNFFDQKRISKTIINWINYNIYQSKSTEWYCDWPGCTSPYINYTTELWNNFYHITFYWDNKLDSVEKNILNSIKFINPLEWKIDKVLVPFFNKIEKKNVENQILIYNKLISKIEKINTNELNENQKFIIEYLSEKITNKVWDKEESYCISQWWIIETRKLEQEEWKVCFINDWFDWIRCELNSFSQKKCGHTNNLYYNQKYKFSLTFPENWNWYQVKQEIINNSTNLIRFWFYLEKNNSFSTVFWITIYKTDEIDNEYIDYINAHTIWKNSDYIFTFDWPHEPNPDFINWEYEKISEIIKSFKID